MNDKYIVVTADDEITIRTAEGHFLGITQKAVGGYVEHVRPRGLDEPLCMLVNEDGLCEQLPLNKLGTILYGTGAMLGSAFILFNAPIVGDIVVCKEAYTPDGLDIVPLDDAEANDVYTQMCKNFKFLKTQKGS